MHKNPQKKELNLNKTNDDSFFNVNIFNVIIVVIYFIKCTFLKGYLPDFD